MSEPVADEPAAEPATETTDIALDLDFTGPFTIDEVELIEALTGKAITALGEGQRGRDLRVVAWIVTRRTNPAVQLADVGHLSVKL